MYIVWNKNTRKPVSSVQFTYDQAYAAARRAMRRTKQYKTAKSFYSNLFYSNPSLREFNLEIRKINPQTF